MRSIHRSLRWLGAALLAAAFLGDASAGAFEAHNLLEPPFGTFRKINALAVDESNGNVYATQTELQHEEVQIFGREGGAPAGGVPSSFTSPGSVEEAFSPVGVAVDPATHAVYIADERHRVVERYVLNGANSYEYVCELKYIGAGNRCLADGGEEKESTEPEGTRLVAFEDEGVAVDALGDVYVGGQIGNTEEGAIFEFNAAGEALRVFGLPLHEGEGEAAVKALAIASNGTIYASISAGPPYIREVLELKRSSPVGAAEGEATVIPNTEGGYFSPEAVKGMAFDRASGQLFLDIGSSSEVFNEAREVVSRFGSGVIANGGALAVDEATGEVYVANGGEQNIYRFGPGVEATLPAVDAPPPSLSAVTRTSALLSGTVATGDATSVWHLEYVAADEYQPAAANPYAAGGSTARVKLAPATVGTGVGPVPLAGLLAGKTYHYRLVATNELGTTYGPDHTFTTAPATPPAVTTGAASEVTQTGVLLAGTVGTQELQTSYEFEVGTDPGYGGAKLFGNAGRGGTVAVSASLQFLIPGVTYHYRLVASNADGASYGQDMTFTTPGVSAPIAQPSTEALIPSPTVAFPSVAGAITKAQGPSRKSKAKKRAGKRRKRRGQGKARRGGVKAKRRGGAKRK
jgi:DNA-binding beta-propeller fold protein YncE